MLRHSSGETEPSGSFSHWFLPHLSVPAGASWSLAIVAVVRFQKRRRSAAGAVEQTATSAIESNIFLPIAPHRNRAAVAAPILAQPPRNTQRHGGRRAEGASLRPAPVLRSG